MGGRRQVTRPCLRNICLSLDYVYSIPRPRKVIETLRAHCPKKLLKLHLTKIQRVDPPMHREQGIWHWQGPGTMPWKRFQDKAWGYQIRIDRNRRTDPGEARQRKEREGRRDGGPETETGSGERKRSLSPAFSLPVFLWWNTGLPRRLPPAGDELRLISQQVFSHCARTQEKAPISWELLWHTGQKVWGRILSSPQHPHSCAWTIQGARLADDCKALFFFWAAS